MFETGIDVNGGVAGDKMAPRQHQILMWRRLARGTCQRVTPAKLAFINSTHAASRNLIEQIISCSRFLELTSPTYCVLHNAVLEKILVNLIKLRNGLKSNFNDKWQKFDTDLLTIDYKKWEKITNWHWFFYHWAQQNINQIL